MAEPIGPGDWVECIDDSYNPKAGLDPIIRIGQIYQVNYLLNGVNCAFCGGKGGLNLVGFHPDSNWCPTRFRPIYRPKATFIEGLKTPIEIKSKETVE